MTNQKAEILSGAKVADAIKQEVKTAVARLREENNVVPTLVVVRVGEDEASKVYVGNKVKTSEELGINSRHVHLDEGVSQAELLAIVRDLNADAEVDGILVQLPLPKNLDEAEIIETIAPEKDVDGFSPINAGYLSLGRRALAPCTPAGVIELLERNNVEIAGKHAVVVGRSNIVGKPMAQMLLERNATVTICHSRTKNLSEITRQADILIAAVGRAGFLNAEHIGENAVVVDVGINKITDAEQIGNLFDETEHDKRRAAIEKRGFTLTGDVNQRDSMRKASKFTPVPGGVGLLTVAMLMKNTLEACRLRRKLDRRNLKS